MTTDGNVLLVADDLTGAMDTAHGFAGRGHGTVVRVLADGMDAIDSSVVAVNAETRYADEATARRAVARVVSDALGTANANANANSNGNSNPNPHSSERPDRTPLVYKKVDSTLRGNVLAELEATLEAADADLAIVAPAFPAAGRTTRDGVHLVDGVSLAETAYVDDEKGAASAHLPTLCSASRYPVRHVTLERVAAGSDALVGDIRRIVGENEDAEGLVLTFDATDETHLETIADAAADCGERVVYVGSGGLARYVAVPGGEPDDDGDERERGRERRSDTTSRTRADARGARVEGRGALGVVGSVNERTLAQLAAVPSEAVVELEPSSVVTAPEEAGRRGGARAAALLAGGLETAADEGNEPAKAVITAARSRETLEETLSIGRDRGYEPAEIRSRAKRALARAARAAVDARRPAGLFITGGDVAVAVCEALEAPTIELTGEAVADGVPLGRVATGPLAGTAVVTKAGGFGDESVIVNSLNRLEESSRD